MNLASTEPKKINLPFLLKSKMMAIQIISNKSTYYKIPAIWNKKCDTANFSRKLRIKRNMSFIRGLNGKATRKQLLKINSYNK